MNRIDHAFAFVGLAVVLSCNIAISQEPGGPIHQSLGPHLKDAAKGEHVDLGLIKDDIRQAVVLEIDTLIQSAGASTEADTKSVAEKVQASKEGLAENVERVLLYELTCVKISEKEIALFRATLDRLNLRMDHDYSLSVGAIPREQTTVRIRLPDLHVCQGCKRMLEKALNETEGFEKAVVNLQTCTAQFVAQADLEIEDKLNALQAANIRQLDEWELIWKQ